MRGRFITFEGPEGSGKSTQAGRLASRLRQAGLPVVTTREPGGTPTGELIRDVVQHDLTGEPICAEAEVLLFAASRAQLVRRVIRPALTRGDWVISDRFADSKVIRADGTQAFWSPGDYFSKRRRLTNGRLYA